MSAKSLVSQSLVLASLSTVAVFAQARTAQATVESLTNYHVVVERLQSEDLCLLKVPAYAEYGIPGVPEAELSAEPLMIPRRASAGPVTSQANAIATFGGAKVLFVDVTYDDDNIPTYTFTVDMLAAQTQNGNSLVGRTKTLKAAKLTLLALNENFVSVFPNSYRFFAEFVNLPNQDDLAGTPLNATTMWPYTNSSEFITAYKAELLNLNGSCF